MMIHRIRIVVALLLVAVCAVRVIIYPSGWAIAIGILALILAVSFVVKGRET